MYCPENEVKIISEEHLNKVWQTGHWYLNQIHVDHVIVSNYRPDSKNYNGAFWFRCPIDMFLALEETTEVTALIFHMSRCGSTLFRNLMNVNQICLNEPFMFNQCVMIKDSNLVGYMKRLNGKQSYVMVKTSSWNITQIDWLKKQFPKSKTIFICRDPMEVLASFYLGTNGWINSQDILALFDPIVGVPDRLIRFSLCLEQIMYNAHKTDILVTYENIINETIYGKFPELLGYKVDQKKMLEVSKVNSKKSGQFESDTKSKEQIANLLAESIPQEIINRITQYYKEITSGFLHIR